MPKLSLHLFLSFCPPDTSILNCAGPLLPLPQLTASNIYGKGQFSPLEGTLIKADLQLTHFEVAERVTHRCPEDIELPQFLIIHLRIFLVPKYLCQVEKASVLILTE